MKVALFLRLHQHQIYSTRMSDNVWALISSDSSIHYIWRVAQEVSRCQAFTKTASIVYYHLPQQALFVIAAPGALQCEMAVMCTNEKSVDGKLKFIFVWKIPCSSRT